LSLLGSSPANLTRVVFGLTVIVYFWFRKNALLKFVESSNGAFATLAIASVSFLLLFMYALAADPMYVGGPPTLLLQSISFLIGSLFGYWSLRYALRAGLVAPANRSAAQQIERVDLANPLTAVIAAALSWSGLVIWTLSWFVLWPIFGALLARGSKPATQR
jgi:hypothetical protein